MMDRVLWERSGHWDKYAGSDVHYFFREPWNTRSSQWTVLVTFKSLDQGLKSYRDLPLYVLSSALASP